MNHSAFSLPFDLKTACMLAMSLSLCACGGGGSDSTSNPIMTTPIPSPSIEPSPASSELQWKMPDEQNPHAATWMAFVAKEEIWGRTLSTPVQDTLARIANTIVAYEPVNMLVREQDFAIARQKLDPRVNLIVQELDDLWLRDTGPVFVIDQKGQKAAVNFNFNGWGKKQSYSNDAKIAAAIAQRANVKLIQSKLVLEGGSIEVDGKGTAILTESSVINANRNPGMSKSEIEAELKTKLGLRKIIWLPGIAGQDITDGHVDFYARFVRPGVVVAHLDSDPDSYDYAVTRKHLEILRAARDADNRPLQVIVLEAPTIIRKTYSDKDFAAGYINFYVVNGAVIAPQFGDAVADANAKARLGELFPGRAIIQLDIDPIAAGGGGIHCTTQQEPRI
ncbi:agmatine deiminase family protein [Deefgea rivuli]|uniref:agmatine deiminase family protein n=1 Tax=Deefgea rivuli TaxID=400948 RepID=UPI000A74E93E|nr:agmatine deiminase family protein [Deefgea rivuli]